MQKPPESNPVEEQIAYYRARADEYDEWFLRKGRYDRGQEHTKKWFGEVQVVVDALSDLGPLGDVIEFAGGTGIWTQRLADAADSITVVDSSPEMIELNRRRLVSREPRYIQSSIFDFEPDRSYDFAFFGFWLSHVPSDRFDAFWRLVSRCLRPGGTFFFVDSQKEPLSTAVNHQLPIEDECETLVRKLNDGREFNIYKLFYNPEALKRRLEGLGFEADVKTTDSFFLYGSGKVVGR